MCRQSLDAGQEDRGDRGDRKMTTARDEGRGTRDEGREYNRWLKVFLINAEDAESQRRGETILNFSATPRLGVLCV